MDYGAPGPIVSQNDGDDNFMLQDLSA